MYVFLLLQELEPDWTQQKNPSRGALLLPLACGGEYRQRTVLIIPPIYQINSRTLWSPSYKGFERSLLSYKGWQGEEAILLQQIPQSSHRSTNPSLHFLAPQQLIVEDWGDRLWDPTGIQYRKKSEETDNCRCTNNTSWDSSLPVTIHSGPTLPYPILPPRGYLQK